MSPRSTRAFALGLAAVGLAACPRKPVPPPTEPSEQIAERPTLVSSWADVDLSLYAALAAAPPDGLAVGDLARRHDADRYTASLESWGPPDVAVLQLEDTDTPTRAVGAVAGWKVSGDPPNGSMPVEPDALKHGDLAQRLVTGVLLRGWEGTPSASDPFDLLLAEAATLPGPWSVCRPRTADQAALEEAEDVDPKTMPAVVDPTVLFAIDGARGIRIGLHAQGDVAPGAGPFTWEVDHVEQAPAARPTDRLWAELGYGDCPEIGKVIDAERARRPKRPLGPPDAPE